MSLVDYASSDEEEEQLVNEQEKRHRSPVQLPPPNLNPPPPSRNKSSSSDFRLPDASFLLNSPSMPSHSLHGLDHGSRVAKAMAENASRKRELTGPSSSFPRSKVPKGALPHSKNGPDTAKGLLLPPQLTGRSNVVTEDISKLFVKKRVNSSP